MISSLAQPPLAEPPPVLSQDHLQVLAQTYDRVPVPVWIHDLEERCVYRNPCAGQGPRGEAETLVFDIVDHRGRTLCRLKAGVGS